MRSYGLLIRSNGGWKEVADFNAVDVEAAKKMADDYASTIGVGPNDVAVEEIGAAKSSTSCMPFAKHMVSTPAVSTPAVSTPAVSRLSSAGPLATGASSIGPLERMNKAYPVKNGKEIGIGQTIENKHIRAHRFASSIKVTDLQNAGKRGKKVDRFALYDLDYIRGEQPTSTNLYLFACSLSKLDYNVAYRWAKALVEDARIHHHHIGFQADTERGVDVAPAGFKEIEILEKHFSISADNKGFSISDLDDRQNETRAISLDRFGKKNPKKFYEWVFKNKDQLAGKTFFGVLHMMEKEGINYHTYCGMD
jgi:hypothetical protein